jgi:hypothetical protein
MSNSLIHPPMDLHASTTSPFPRGEGVRRLKDG